MAIRGIGEQVWRTSGQTGYNRRHLMLPGSHVMPLLGAAMLVAACAARPAEPEPVKVVDLEAYAKGR